MPLCDIRYLLSSKLRCIFFFSRPLGHDPSDTELKDIINDVDSNHDGMIDFDEFLEMMARKISGPEVQAGMIKIKGPARTFFERIPRIKCHFDYMQCNASFMVFEIEPFNLRSNLC